MGCKGFIGCLATILALGAPAQVALAQTVRVDVSQTVKQEGAQEQPQEGETGGLQDVCVTYAIRRAEEGAADSEDADGQAEAAQDADAAGQAEDPTFSLTGDEKRQISFEAGGAGTWEVRPKEVAGTEGTTCVAEGQEDQDIYVIELHEASDGSLIPLVRQKGDDAKRSVMAWTVRVPTSAGAEEEAEPEQEPESEPEDELTAEESSTSEAEPEDGQLQAEKGPSEKPAADRSSEASAKALPKTSDMASPLPYAVLGAAGACIVAGGLLRRR